MQSILQAISRETLVLIFAGLGALGPPVTLLVFWLNRRKERSSELRTLRSQWSLDVVKENDVSAIRLASIRLDDPETNRFRLVRMRAKQPRGLKLGIANYEDNRQGYGGGGAWKDDGNFVRTLSVHKDAQSDSVMGPGGRVSFDHWTVHFYASVPSKPWFFRSDRTRLSIRISVEDRSSSRVRRHFIVKS